MANLGTASTLSKAEKRRLLSDKLGIELYPGDEVLRDVPGVGFETQHTSSTDLVLVPTPADDPADPLNWSPLWKAWTYGGCLMYVFWACSPSLSVSVFYGPLIMEFKRPLSEISYFTGSMILALGWFNCIFVPLGVTNGRRPVLLISNAICIGSYIWQAKATTFGSFMGGRILNGVGAALIETIGAMVAEDLFFVHQRARALALYLMLLLAATGVGPFIASVFTATVGWRYFWWFSLGMNVITQAWLFLTPETKYRRLQHGNPGTASSSIPLNQLKATDLATTAEVPESLEKDTAQHIETEAGVAGHNRFLGKGRPPRSAFKFWFPRSPDEATLAYGIISPFRLLSFPIIIWISLMFSFVASTVLLTAITAAVIFGAPPYNFSVIGVGAVNLSVAAGAIIGTAIGGPLSDWDSNRRTRKNDYIKRPEMRLPLALPFAVAWALGGAAIGISASAGNSWPIIIIVAIPVCLIGGSALSTIVFALAVDCYPRYTGEIFLIATVVKNTISFALTYGVVDWILSPTFGFKGAFGTWLSIGFLGFLIGWLGLYFYGPALRKRSAAHRLMRDE